MSFPGKPSTAHEYDKRGECVHCGMYKVNVDLMTHDCTRMREAWADGQAVLAADRMKLQQAQAYANDHGE